MREEDWIIEKQAEENQHNIVVLVFILNFIKYSGKRWDKRGSERSSDFPKSTRDLALGFAT